MSGPIQGSPVSPALCQAKRQSIQAQALGDGGAARQQLRLVGIVPGADALGQAVGAEDGQQAILSRRSAGNCARAARMWSAIRSRYSGWRCQLIDEGDREGIAELRRALLDRLAIAADADPRVVRRQRDRDDPRMPSAGHPRQHVGDERVPVLHPGVDAVAWPGPLCSARPPAPPRAASVIASSGVRPPTSS